MSPTKTESCYLAYLSIATNLDALRSLSILHTFFQSFNYNNFISHLIILVVSSYLSQIQYKLDNFHHFQRACTLVQKSYCYTPGVRVRVRVGVSVGVRVRMQNVRANVKVMEFKSLCIFSCILAMFIILIKPLTTKAHDRRASGDCGTSGFFSTQSDSITITWIPLCLFVSLSVEKKYENYNFQTLFD